MAGEKKVKKTKKEEEGGAAPAEEPKRESKRESKKAQKAESNIFSKFSPKQLTEFKEGFSVMDTDKDGILSKADLKATWDSLGRACPESELDTLVAEAQGPLNFTQLLQLFASRMSGGAVDEDVVVAAFNSFDEGGTIDPDRLRKALTTFGEKFTDKEVDEVYAQMTMEGGKIDTKKLISLLTAKGED